METNIERRDKILLLRSQGKSYNEIAKELNCNKSLVAFYCGKRFSIDEQNEREDSKKEYELIVCELAKKCNNINQICKALGKRGTNTNRAQVENILVKNNVDFSHFSTENKAPKKFVRYDDDKVYCKNSAIKNTKNIHKRLIKDGIKEEKCECCGNTEWLGKPIPLQVHHINGDNTDNRIENLQMLCPNCHTFTDTYCGRSKKKNETRSVRESKMPSLENIIDAIKKYKTFTGVGRFFGVSDNTVRKWCKKRNLPTCSKDLRLF